jgi:hypothetical protein
MGKALQKRHTVLDHRGSASIVRDAARCRHERLRSSLEDGAGAEQRVEAVVEH